MKSHIMILALLAALSALPACKNKQEQGADVTVQFTVGDARIVSSRGEKAASPGDAVSNDDTIVTGASSIVDLNFGTRGVIRINEKSRVRIASLQGSSGNEQAQLDMKTGKITVIMSRLSKDSSFSITTPTTLAAIRGTSFMVVSDPSNSKIYVLKGRILVQLAQEGKLAGKIEKMLEANKKVVVSEDLAKEIIAGKRQMEAVAMSPKEISDIKKEMKDIRTSEKLDPEAKKELEEITADKTATPQKQGTQAKDIQTIPNI